MMGRVFKNGFIFWDLVKIFIFCLLLWSLFWWRMLFTVLLLCCLYVVLLFSVLILPQNCCFISSAKILFRIIIDKQII